MLPPPELSPRFSRPKKRSLPLRLFQRQKRAKTSLTPYYSTIERDLNLLRSPLPQIPMSPTLHRTQTIEAIPPFTTFASPVTYDYAISPTSPFNMPIPTFFGPPTSYPTTDSKIQSSSSSEDESSEDESSEDESDEYISPSSYTNHPTLPFPQPIYSQYTFNAQTAQRSATAPPTYHPSVPIHPPDDTDANNTSSVASVVLTQTITHQHPPQVGGYTRHSTTFACAQSPGHQTRSFSNNSVSISGSGNVIIFGERRQTTQT